MAVASELNVAQMVRDHVAGFYDGDVSGSRQVCRRMWSGETGTELLAGREQVAAFLAAAVTGLTPALEIRAVVADRGRAAAELIETYHHQGAERRAWIAAFFDFDGG